MSKLIIIGNGYDLSLKLNITFSNFMKTQRIYKGSGYAGDNDVYVEYVETFLIENSGCKVKKNIFKKGAAGYVSREVDFRDVFSDINSWNELEVRLDNIYDDHDENIFPDNMEDFLENFSEEFERWLNFETKGKEFPETIKYVEYDENDIILNLNFTNTIPKGYKNEIKVHKLTGYDDFLYIGPHSIKNDSEVIQNKLSKVLKLVKDSQEPIEKIVIYGANMHAKEVVDMHIIDFINENIFDEINIDYINVAVKDLEQEFLQERFDGRKINYIDGTKEDVKEKALKMVIKKKIEEEVIKDENQEVPSKTIGQVFSSGVLDSQIRSISKATEQVLSSSSGVLESQIRSISEATNQLPYPSYIKNKEIGLANKQEQFSYLDNKIMEKRQPYCLECGKYCEEDEFGKSQCCKTSVGIKK